LGAAERTTRAAVAAAAQELGIGVLTATRHCHVGW
jgi:hypothetical protein